MQRIDLSHMNERIAANKLVLDRDKTHSVEFITKRRRELASSALLRRERW